ncbi:MAG: flagellar basal body protein FliL, partial [Fervidobacterium sp.]
MPEEMEQQEQGGKSKKGLPIKAIIQMVGIPLIVSLVVTVTVLFLLGSNQQTQEKKESQQLAAP